jgi:hypothetical protein
VRTEKVGNRFKLGGNAAAEESWGGGGDGIQIRLCRIGWTFGRIFGRIYSDTDIFPAVFQRLFSGFSAPGGQSSGRICIARRTRSGNRFHISDPEKAWRNVCSINRGRCRIFEESCPFAPDVSDMHESPWGLRTLSAIHRRQVTSFSVACSFVYLCLIWQIARMEMSAESATRCCTLLLESETVTVARNVPKTSRPVSLLNCKKARTVLREEQVGRISGSTKRPSYLSATKFASSDSCAMREKRESSFSVVSIVDPLSFRVFQFLISRDLLFPITSLSVISSFAGSSRTRSI